MRATLLAAFAIVALAVAALSLPAAAQSDIPALEALREGGMKKLNFAAAPQEVPDLVLARPDGTEGRLSDYAGRIVVLNFWATWCAPCRHEMPALDRLNAELGGADFAVVTLATGRNSPAGMRRFFEEEGIATLPLYQDRGQEGARQMAVLGLPITVILDRRGFEIARLRGDAEWDSASAKAILQALIAAPPES